MTSPTTSPNPIPPTAWQLWDLILSHLHNIPTSKLVIEGTRKGIWRGGSYTEIDLYYETANVQNATIAYIRLQDNMEHSMLQNCILPPLDCPENQIDVLASLLVQRFEENGQCQVFIHHEPASLTARNDIAHSVTSWCKDLGYTGALNVAVERHPRLPNVVPLIPGGSEVPRHDDDISLHIGWQEGWLSDKPSDEGGLLSNDEPVKQKWWAALKDVVRRAVDKESAAVSKESGAISKESGAVSNES